ncbi:MAG: hypothetical protein KF774_11120 [Planctomyces sp.]|nr:hypothetical protein [Planctomyces sp.]
MLEVIECLQLFLDHDDVARRMVVVMAAEERFLADALAKKYRLRAGPNYRAVQDQILADNIDKLFLLHLRLGELSSEDRVEIATKYCDERQKSSTLTRSPSTPGATTPAPALNDMDAPGVEPKSESNVDSVSDGAEIRHELGPVDCELSVDESKRLVDAVRHASGSSRRSWGPRTVRKFILNYQFARMLLRATKVDATTEEIIGAMQKAASDADDGVSPVKNVERIVRQVVSVAPSANRGFSDRDAAKDQ